jgi:lysophospholipase L1-like esterase
MRGTTPSHGRPIAVLLLLSVALGTACQRGLDALRWGKDLEAFEREDRAHPPPAGAVLFVGSSSIKRWPVRQAFPELPVINRGLGGSEIRDATRLAERIVLPYAPSVVVFYAGDNDVAAGRSPRQVLEDYREFVARLHARHPACRIVFVSIKPSPARWERVERMREANRRVADFCATDERLLFVDVDAPMIGPDGRPRPEFYAADGLHLSDAGYEVWNAALRPLLHAVLGAPGRP